MGGSRGSQGIKYGRGQTSSTTMCSMFADCRAQLSQSWNKEVFRSLDQSFIMCEMVDTYTSRSTRVACAEPIKAKNDRENLNRGYEVQIEGPYLVEKLQSTRGHIQISGQPRTQAIVAEASNKNK